MADPNPDDPLMQDVAKLFRSDYDQFHENAVKCTREHACIGMGGLSASIEQVPIDEQETRAGPSSSVVVDDSLPAIRDVGVEQNMARTANHASYSDTQIDKPIQTETRLAEEAQEAAGGLGESEGEKTDVQTKAVEVV